MAYGGRELRLILSIQSYGTSNIARLRRDITALGSATKAANAEQLAVQSEILRKAQQLTKLQDRITAQEVSSASRRSALLARGARSEANFNKQRVKNSAQATALANAAAMKRLAIGKTQDSIVARTAKSELSHEVAMSRLGTRRLSIQQSIRKFEPRGQAELASSSAILRNKASQLRMESKLAKAGQLAAAKKFAEPFVTTKVPTGTRAEQALQYQYRAAVQEAKRLQIADSEIAQTLKIHQSELATIVKQEELLKAGKDAEAAAIGRQNELLQIQEQQLNAIVARQADVAAAIAAIDKEEAAANAEIAQQLALLEKESVELGRMRVQAGEIAAEMQMMTKEGLAYAASIDAAAAAQSRLQRREALARTAAHGFRTAQFGGLITGAVLVGAGNAAANFNKQLTLAATQARNLDAPVSQTVKRMHELQDGLDQNGKHFEGILELMQQFPASAEDMANSAYDIYSSMSVSFGGGLKLLKKFNELAVATGSDLETATNAGITVLNNFANSGQNVDKTLNLMVATIRFGRLRLDEFNQMLAKVAPAAGAADQRLQDVAGAIALITRKQPSPQMGATGLSRLLQVFQNPNFQKGTFKFGVDITKGAGAVGKLKPLPQVITDIAKGFKNISTIGGPGQLFKELTAVGFGRGVGQQSTIQAQRTFTFLYKNLKEYQNLQKAVTGDTGEFAKSLKALSASPGVKWQIFVNSMRAFIITIGEAALPALLKLAGYLQTASQWFEHLSKGMREGIVRFLVFGSAVALVLGTIGNFVTGAVAFSANLKIMQGSLAATASEAEAAAASVSVFSASMMALGGLSLIAIPIVIQLLRGGDPTAWGLAAAAGFGAIGGAMVGGAIGTVLGGPGIGTAIGAAIGAVAVPITVELISHFQKDKQPLTQVQKAYNAYVKQFQQAHPGDQAAGVAANLRGKKIGGPLGGRVAAEQLSFDQWKKMHPKFVKALEVQDQILNSSGSKRASLQDKYNKLTKSFNKQYVNDLKNSTDALTKAYNQQTNAQGSAQSKQVQLARAHAQAMKTALSNEQQTIKTATDNIEQVYDGFQQTLQQGFGQVFGGPTMQGVLGQVFGDINDQLRQFGIQIPVPFKILRQDMDQQMAYFKRWRTDLDKLLKRGAPLPLVQQIEQLGPTAIPMIEGLLGASPKQLNKYFSDFKASQKKIDAAAKVDTDQQLKYWLSYGKKIAYNIIMGLSSGPAQSQLRAGYKKYVTDVFGSILKAQVAKDVKTAMKQANQEINAVAAAKNAAGKSGQNPFTQGASGTTTAIAKGIAGMTIDQTNAALKKARRTAAKYGPVTGKGIDIPGTESPMTPAYKAAEKRIHRLEAHRRALLARERTSITNQLRRGLTKGESTITITYGGDTVHVNADGATPASVMRALNKAHFRKMHQRKARHH